MVYGISSLLFFKQKHVLKKRKRKKKEAKMQSVFLWVSRQYYLLFKIT